MGFEYCKPGRAFRFGFLFLCSRYRIKISAFAAVI